MESGFAAVTLAAVSAVLIHEAGHIVAASLFGVKPEKPRAVFGGLSMRLAGSTSYPRGIIILAGGAIFNALFALFPAGALFRACSLGAAVYNLLPLPYTDGEGILYSLLAWRLDAPDTAYRITRAVSGVSLAIFFVFAIYVNAVGIGGGTALLLSLIFLLMRRTSEQF
ncbi:MAG: hypothetical protein LUI15_05480 [Firmicutes bacterium]|nr:hypothetical protein [Bacillota bacterium]